MSLEVERCTDGLLLILRKDNHSAPLEGSWRETLTRREALRLIKLLLDGVDELESEANDKRRELGRRSLWVEGAGSCEGTGVGAA